MKILVSLSNVEALRHVDVPSGHLPAGKKALETYVLRALHRLNVVRVLRTETPADSKSQVPTVRLSLSISGTVPDDFKQQVLTLLAAK